MQRKLFYGAGLFFIIFSFTSCEGITNCKVCQQNTYNSSGDLIIAGTETEYCDANLIAIETTKPVTGSGGTLKWECR